MQNTELLGGCRASTPAQAHSESTHSKDRERERAVFLFLAEVVATLAILSSTCAQLNRMGALELFRWTGHIKAAF